MKQCADVRRSLADYLDGRLHAETEAAVERHLESCDACSAALLRNVDDAREGEFAKVRGLIDGSIEPEEMFDREPGRRPISFWRTPWIYAAAAAVVLAAFSLWAIVTNDVPVRDDGEGRPNANDPNRIVHGSPTPESLLASLGENTDEVATYDVRTTDPDAPAEGFLVHLQKDDRRLVRAARGADDRPLAGRSGQVLWRFDRGQNAMRVGPKDPLAALIRPRPPLAADVTKWAREGRLVGARFEEIGGRRLVTAEHRGAVELKFTIDPATGRIERSVESFGDGEKIEWNFKDAAAALPDATFSPAHWVADGVNVDVDWIGFEASGVSLDELFGDLTLSKDFFGKALVLDTNDARPIADRIVEALTVDGPIEKWMTDAQKKELHEVIERSLGSLPIKELGGASTRPFVITNPPPKLMKKIDRKILDEAKTIHELARIIARETGVEIDVKIPDQKLGNLRMIGDDMNGFGMLLAATLIHGGEIKVVGDRVVIE